jgi:divalent metal cation (Fe/Co/Zn/Cd) transporter
MPHQSLNAESFFVLAIGFIVMFLFVIMLISALASIFADQRKESESGLKPELKFSLVVAKLTSFLPKRESEDRT